MSWLEAAFLGIIQGLTEFLPVSSSGHLVVFQDLLGYQTDSREMLAFDVVSHLGTLLAISVVFRHQFVKLLKFPSIAPRIIGLAAVATLVTAAVAFPLKDQFELLFGKPRWVAVAFIITGILLMVTERLPRPRKGWRRFSWLAAVMVGLAQALAVTPGISRSGATICVAMLLGLRRRWAAEFSFLIAAPSIVGATILELRDLFVAEAAPTIDQPVGAILIGGLVAAVCGYFALRVLLQMLQRARLHWFSYYLWVLAACLLVIPWVRRVAADSL